MRVPLHNDRITSNLTHVSSLYTPCAELEALGDDFLAEDDTSYLDATIGAPDPPTNVPGGSKEDGVKLDEFGLPVLN